MKSFCEHKRSLAFSPSEMRNLTVCPGTHLVSHLQFFSDLSSSAVEEEDVAQHCCQQAVLGPERI